MFGIKRRDNRKARLSNWFARERDGDMQAFDLDAVTSAAGALIEAIKRERALRHSARTAA